MPLANDATGTHWTAEQLKMASIIAKVGQEMGMSRRDIVIGLMTAMQESTLRNLNYGDRDSLGLFQQRPSQGWGSVAQVTDPVYASKKFFTALKGVSDRENMSLSQAAQAVQRSAYPDAYAKWAGDAQALVGGKLPGLPENGPTHSSTTTLGSIPGLEELLNQGNYQPPSPPSVTEVNGLGEITADEAGIGALKFGETDTGGASTQSGPLDALSFDMAPPPQQDPMAKLHLPTLEDFGIKSQPDLSGGDGWRHAVVAAAHKMLGTPYVWGGTSATGVDCSGLISLIYNQRGFELPRLSASQANSGQRVALDQLKPGDLVAWDLSNRNNGADHIAIYIGHGLIIEAPRPGGVVQTSHLYDTSQAWGVRLHR